MRTISIVGLWALLVLVLACAENVGVDPQVGDPTELVVVAATPGAGVAGSALPGQIVVRAQDAAGRGVEGVAVEWAASGDGVVSASPTATDAQGEAGVTWTLRTRTGEDTLTATVEGVAAVRFTIVVGPDAPASVVVAADSLRFDALEDTARLSAAVADRFGNAIADASVTWSSSAADIATVTEDGRVAGHGNGEAVVTARVGAHGDSTIVLVRQRSAALAFSVQPATGHTAAVLAPAVQVSVLDANGHPLADATDTVFLGLGLNPGGGTLSGTTSVPAVAGVATFADLGIDAPGAGYTLLASARGLVGVGSSPFDVEAAPVADFLVEAEGGGAIGTREVGVPFAVRLTARDAAGAVATSFTGTVELTSTGVLTAGGGTTAPFVAGVLASHEVALAGPDTVALTVTRTGGAETGTTGAFPVIRIVRSTIVAGENHSCGLALDGSAHCWGHNDTGQLGDGSNSSTSTPVQVATAVSFTALAAGADHTCGIDSSGAAHCWGLNNYGQLGDSTSLTRFAPVRVRTATRFHAITAGGWHTCGVATDGKVWCWGWNAYGQVGAGDASVGLGLNAPVETEGGLVFTTVAGGASFTCGIEVGGAARCWGYNATGQLGDGTMTDRSTPTTVVTALTFRSITAGGAHACAITPTGEPHCWGFNANGQVGDSTIIQRDTPAPVRTSLPFTAISAGQYHTCGIADAGTPYCWGNGVLKPAAVSTALSFLTIGAGDEHTCAIATDSTAHCWGQNHLGQLGDGTDSPATSPVPVNTAVLFRTPPP